MRFQARIVLVLVLVSSTPFAVSAAFAASDAPAACPAQDALPGSAAAGAPTPEEIREKLDRWRAERVRTLSSLYEVGHPDGSVSIDPHDLFAYEIVMQRNPDGSISIRCMPTAWRTLALTPPVSQPLETR